jgi:pimeloyl-ACP methyl ester carboxylesterase
LQITANGVALEVEDHGSPGGEPLLLIMGLGMQLVAWHEGLVAQWVARGFRVIRFDNRDIGLSQRFDHLGVPNVALGALRHVVGLGVRSPYAIADLAADSAGVLDALGIAGAHVCGASMGGMVAQHLAACHPKRVRSLTLMMTTSGARHLPQPNWRVQMALLGRPARPNDIDSVIDRYVQLFGLIGSPGWPTPPDVLRERIARSVRRSHRPAAVARQLVAIVADGDRSELLERIRVPTQVIHGLADPLVPVAAGRDLAMRIREARADFIEGMGHDLPEPLWPRFVDDVAAVAGRA